MFPVASHGMRPAPGAPACSPPAAARASHESRPGGSGGWRAVATASCRAGHGNCSRCYGYGHNNSPRVPRFESRCPLWWQPEPQPCSGLLPEAARWRRVVFRTSCRGAVTSYKTHQAQLSLPSDKRTNYKNAGAFFPGQRGG